MDGMDKALEERSTEELFYDGECGVCHGAVRFVARRDPEGRLFRFAPLHGRTFEQAFDRETREGLPDSLVVRTLLGQALVRSSALVHVLRRLGGPWRALGHLLWLVPRPLRDLGYDLFARIRHRVVSPPQDSCPVPPREMRGRFDP